jgi:putative transposase
MRALPNRQPIRLGPQNYFGQKYYFVTICCFLRQDIFQNPSLADWLVSLLYMESTRLSFGLHAYCLMPDHLHFLAEGMEARSDLRKPEKSFRIKSSREYARMSGGILWQKRYYDHILRSAESLEPVVWYIWLNPLRKGIALTPGQYPFAGSFTGREMPCARVDPGWSPPWKKTLA